MWIALMLTSIGVYIGYVWIENTFDEYPIARTANILFVTPQFYLIILMNTTVVLLFNAMYIYIKKEYYTEAADFIVSLVKSKKETDEILFERVEDEILQARNKKKMKRSRSAIQGRKGTKSLVWK